MPGITLTGYEHALMNETVTVPAMAGAENLVGKVDIF